MTHIKIGDVAPRVVYMAADGQTDFPFTFPIFSSGDMRVARNEEELSSGFSVVGGTTTDNQGLAINAKVVFDTPSSANDRITLWRDTVVTRTSDYSESGDLRASTLNTDLDRLTAIAQERRDGAARALTLSSADSASVMTPLPLSAARAQRVLAFDINGNPKVSSKTLAEIETQADSVSAQAAAVALAAAEAAQDRSAAEAAKVEAQSARDEAQAVVANISDPLPRDGSAPMVGSLDLGGNGLVNGGSITATDFSGNGAGLSDVTPAHASVGLGQLAENIPNSLQVFNTSGAPAVLTGSAGQVAAWDAAGALVAADPSGGGGGYRQLFSGSASSVLTMTTGDLGIGDADVVSLKAVGALLPNTNTSHTIRFGFGGDPLIDHSNIYSWSASAFAGNNSQGENQGFIRSQGTNSSALQIGQWSHFELSVCDNRASVAMQRGGWMNSTYYRASAGQSAVFVDTRWHVNRSEAINNVQVGFQAGAGAIVLHVYALFKE